MTTMVWDGKTLASDSGLVQGGTRVGHVPKIRRRLTHSGLTVLIGIVGDYAKGTAACEAWLNGEEWPEQHDLDEGADFEIVVIFGDGKVNFFDRFGNQAAGPVPYAGGSGAAFALAALKMGADAEKAVQIACELDINSYGPIQTLTQGE